MNESDILRAIQTKVSGPDIRLFRMQCGRFQLIDGRFINVGVPGMSDLIGCSSVIVTPSMIGQRVAVFTAIEIKSLTGKPTADQLRFIETVKELGGNAGLAHSVEEARDIISRA